MYLQRVGCDLQGVKQMLRFPSSPSWAEAIWSLNRCGGGATVSRSASQRPQQPRRRGAESHIIHLSKTLMARLSPLIATWHDTAKEDLGKSASHWFVLARSCPEQKSYPRKIWERARSTIMCFEKILSGTKVFSKNSLEFGILLQSACRILYCSLVWQYDIIKENPRNIAAATTWSFPKHKRNKAVFSQHNLIILIGKPARLQICFYKNSTAVCSLTWKVREYQKK